MPTTIDSLELQVKNGSSDAVKGIDSLAASLGKLKTATKGGIGLTSVVNQLNKLNEATKNTENSGLDKLANLSETLGKLSSLGNLKLGSIANGINKIGEAVNNISLSGVENLEDITKALQGLSSVRTVRMPKVTGGSSAGGSSGDTTTSVGSDVSEATDDVNRYTDTVEQASNASNRLKAILSSLGGVFRKTGADSADSFVKRTSDVDILKMKLQGAKEKLNSLLSADTRNNTAIANVTGQIKQLEEELKKAKRESNLFNKALGSLGNGLKKIGSAGVGFFKRQLDKATAPFKNITAESKKFLHSIKRIAMYRAIRFFFSQLAAVMKEGINNLYKYSNAMGGTFAGSMDRLATSFQYLKNSLGAMVSPIINALAPAIDFVIDKFVALLNIMNQFFARLTGASTFTAAKKQATSYGGAISSAGGAAKKAAKEIKDATLGIDELNIISQPDNDTASGGGGGGADYGSMFEELPIGNAISDFADKLKAAFEAGDWKELGTLLGNKFNEIVDSIDWSGVGHKIGYGLNGAIQIAYWSLKTADFKNLGNHIAELLNGALEEIDFTYVGRLLVRGITAGLDLLIGFLGGLDWGLVGKSIGDGLRGAFDEAYEWITSYDWGKMADSVYENLKKFLLGIDFSTLAQSFFRMLGAALGAAVSLIGTFVPDVVGDIADYFKQYINTDGDKHWWEIGADIIKGIFEGIWNAIKNIGVWIYDNVFKPFIDGFKNAFGIHSPSTVMKEQGGYIIDGLLEGLLEFPKKIAETVKKWGKKLIDWFTGGDGNGNIVDKFKQKASDIVGGFRDKIGSTYTTVKTNITTWASKVKEWYTSSSFGGVNAENFKTFANNVITGFKDKIGSAYTNTKSNITTWASNVKSWFSGIASSSAFSGFASDVINGFKNKIGNSYTDAKSNMQTFGSSVLSWFKENASYSKFYDVASDVISGFKNGIGNLYSTCKSTISSWGSSIISWFKNKLDSNSPSKVFERIGKDTVLGYNNGLEDYGTKTKGIVNKWADSFTGIQPQFAYAFAVDTSALDYYDSDDYVRSLQSNVNTRNTFTVTGFKEGMEEFYKEYVEPTINRMADDVRRQADKQEKTVVQIGNKTISDAVTTQKNADGYSFIK